MAICLQKTELFQKIINVVLKEVIQFLFSSIWEVKKVSIFLIFYIYRGIVWPTLLRWNDLLTKIFHWTTYRTPLHVPDANVNFVLFTF